MADTYPEDEREQTRPPVPVPGDDEEELSRRCIEERDDLSPHETADCAGLSTSEVYESEEDGGS